MSAPKAPRQRASKPRSECGPHRSPYLRSVLEQAELAAGTPLLDAGQVAALFGLDRARTYTTLSKRPGFPARIQLAGRLSRWPKDQVLAWKADEERRIAELVRAAIGRPTMGAHLTAGRAA
jgi:predicted DNA-binding transcriptional regulator AlpA